jgi:hypothetical protein
MTFASSSLEVHCQNESSVDNNVPREDKQQQQQEEKRSAQITRDLRRYLLSFFSSSSPLSLFSSFVISVGCREKLTHIFNDNRIK